MRGLADLRGETLLGRGLGEAMTPRHILESHAPERQRMSSSWLGEFERRALRDEVYDRVLDKLLWRGSVPGERLSAEALAQELHVSPTPVREALVQLERTGLVTREALKGYRVAPPLDEERLEELFSARVLLEVEATHLAAAHADELLPELRRAHEDHRKYGDLLTQAMENGEPLADPTRLYFDADRAFHEVIFRGSRNRYLLSMYQGLGALTHRMRQAGLHGVSDIEASLEEHAAVLEAFSTNPTQAAERMKAHILGVRDRVLGHALADGSSSNEEGEPGLSLPSAS
jgi:DNA-binding GntR family transcriptional regulator